MQQTLQARDLDSTWLPSFTDVKILSLNCFDTLLWRKTATPIDVFLPWKNQKSSSITV